jgi:translation initiation factor 1
MDWKEALNQLKNSEDIPQVEDEPIIETENKTKSKKETLHVLIDRKQRKGKTATIIEGFLCDDQELKEVAKLLKTKIGAGGSSRAGEILLQGDWKDKVSAILKEMGYKVK